MARLKPGVTVERANAEVQVLYESFVHGQAAKVQNAQERQRVLRQRAAVLAAAAGNSELRSQYAESLLVLMAIVALVLLLACANLSSLLVARAASRQREISIRRAIGAGRGRLVRQFLAESLVLAVLGGVGGLVLARWFSNALVVMMANGGRLDLRVGPDWRVLAFTGAVSLLACLMAGLAPAFHAAGSNVNPALKEVRTGGGTAWARRLGSALVIAQLSISMVLLVGANLFIGTLLKLYRVESGFRTEGVLAFGVRSGERYPAARALEVQTAIVDRLHSLPGVTSASAVQLLPISNGLWDRTVQVEGYTFRTGEDERVGYNAIAPKYFATMGTPLLLGRDFDTRDAMRAGKVAIVNESFARHFFGGRSPVGRHVTSVNVTTEIIGVVKDAKYTNLRDAIPMTIYIPWTQREDEQPTAYTYLAHVGGRDPMQLAAMLDRMARDIDPALRVRSAETFAAIVDQSTVKERIMAALGGFFGLLALVVACLGIFGVMAFQVSRRIHELGVRMALGAGKSDILSLVLREVAYLLLAGSAIGCAAALSVTRLAATMLFGVTPTDPGVFGLSVAILGAATFAAAWLPAQRASRVDPIAALRQE